PEHVCLARPPITVKQRRGALPVDVARPMDSCRNNLGHRYKVQLSIAPARAGKFFLKRRRPRLRTDSDGTFARLTCSSQTSTRAPNSTTPFGGRQKYEVTSPALRVIQAKMEPRHEERPSLRVARIVSRPMKYVVRMGSKPRPDCFMRSSAAGTFGFSMNPKWICARQNPSCRFSSATRSFWL